MDPGSTTYRGDAGMDPGISKRIRNSSSTMVNLKSFPDGKSALLTTAYRGDAGIDPGSRAYRGDAGMDPGSRNALEIVRTLWFIYEFLPRETVSF